MKEDLPSQTHHDKKISYGKMSLNPDKNHTSAVGVEGYQGLQT
jgi:hypothetical protein